MLLFPVVKCDQNIAVTVSALNSILTNQTVPAIIGESVADQADTSVVNPNAKP